jgi:hypothetical protein
MIRKMLVVAAAVAIPLGLVAATGGMASAKAAPPINATTNTVTCTGVAGSAKFNPPLKTSEAAGNETTSIKASLTGCTSNAAGLTVTSAKVSGSFSSSHTAGTNGCASLAGSSTESGVLTVTWKTSPKLSSGASSVTVNSVSGGIGSDGNATFTIPGSTPDSGSGSFSGTDHGASDTTTAQTTTSATSILSTCEGKKGLKSIGIESPQSGNAAFLG